MSNSKTLKNLQAYEARYQSQRASIWQAFNEQLNRLQHQYGVTVTELAEGLGISRQKFYDFRATPEKGLAIDRIAVIVLWEYLSDPNTLATRRISVDTRRLREQLQQEGPNPLLTSAGFLPLPSDTASDESTRSETKRESGLKRVEARLTSPWIEDGLRQAHIIDTILDVVKEQGRVDKALHTEPISAAKALNWLSEDPLNIDSPTIIHTYQQKIRSLVRLGKSQFVGVELFELYQNILEYESIDSYSGSGVCIVDCQFPILSVSLPASVQGKFKDFRPIYQQAELALLQLLYDPKQFNFSQLSPEELFTPLVRATIKARFDGEKNPTIWRYSSTGTHFENMLSAIKFGLGSSLDMTGFSIQATGITPKSLARVSIGLAERDDAGKISRVYQGWWVDLNAIIAVLVATVIATKDWLSDYSADVSKYFAICHQLGEIDNTLYLVRETVQEYFFRNAGGYFENTSGLDDDAVFDTIDAQLTNISQALSSQQSQPYYQAQHRALENRQVKTKLTRMRLALKNSDVGKATQIVDEAKSFLSQYEQNSISTEGNPSKRNAYYHILFLQASECVMLYNFYSGDREFLTGKLWRHRPRYQLEENLKKLGKYIKAIGLLNFDVFSCASHMFGTIGLLELYMAQEKDVLELQTAAEHLLWAAHYSQRIGYIRRATYWFTHASRVYCRLGNLDKSEQLSEIASVMADSVHQSHQEELKYDFMFKALITAINHLAEGERLLVKEEPGSACLSFLKALKLFTDTHFTDRLTADALYGLYRASRNISGNVGDAFNALSDDTHLNSGMGAVLKNIIDCLQQIDPNSSWLDSSSSFKELAKSIWHHWLDVGHARAASHPIEEAIEFDQFLSVVNLS
ncbi:MAG: helix-turn-helix domain-containing protein [Leptolyngbyaceae cyanobacterium]